MKHIITLSEYSASCDEEPLYLGTAESYGVELLDLMRGAGWDGLSLSVTYHPPRGQPAVQVRAKSDDTADVPPEATAHGGKGEIVITGYEDGVKRCSCGLAYCVCSHAPAQADPPADPTPDLVQQILTAANSAEKTANSVREDADAGKFKGEQGPPGPQGETKDVMTNFDIQEILNMLD